MYNNQIPSNSTHQEQDQENNENENIREIHALSSPLPPPPQPSYLRRREAWETTSHHRSSSLSVTSSTESDNFTTMSREFSALVLAGNDINNGNEIINEGANSNLERIHEEDHIMIENNPLAIVPDNIPMASNLSSRHDNQVSTSVHMVKKEEVESKICAWQNAKISKINNRFKREDAIINGWENEQVHKSNTWMKKVERKLEAKRARAMEKMQNDIAKARQKSEERRATAEAKRGTKVARVMEVSNLMRAVGRAPAKRSFF